MERIYNLFLHFEDDLCSTVAYRVHEHDGDDAAAIELLRARVDVDLKEAEKVSLKTPFSRARYNAKCRLGTGHHLYEDVFVHVEAASNPLFVATPVVEGQPEFTYSAKVGEFEVNEAQSGDGLTGMMEDWLTKYMSPEGLKLSQLIHDDYFLAIKLTYNASFYVSSVKLLVSCLDSISYIEYRNRPGAFISWLNAYADLRPLGISAEELWELRNGLLHMSNLNSNKVRANKIRRISFKVGGPSGYGRNGLDGIHYFDLRALILAFADAQAKWIETYNSDREKFDQFVERYDETVSDSRLGLFRPSAGQDL